MSRRKIDWANVEGAVRRALNEYANGETLAVDALRGIDEALAHYTGRGNELPEEELDWEPSGTCANGVKWAEQYAIANGGVDG